MYDECEKCAKGRYQTNMGQLLCLDCASGKHSDEEGMSEGRARDLINLSPSPPQQVDQVPGLNVLNF